MKILNNPSVGGHVLEAINTNCDLPSSPGPDAQLATRGKVRAQESEYCRPRRRTDISLRILEGEVVILDRQTGLVHQLNHTASHIWQCCDGQLTVAEIGYQISQTFDVDDHIAAYDVATIIKQFDNMHLLEWC